MQLAIIKITQNGSDEAVVLNGNIILTADPSTSDSTADPSISDSTANIHTVSQNLAEALGTPIKYINHAGEDEWSWDGVLSHLIGEGVINSGLTGTTQLINTTIADWRLSDGYEREELAPEHQGDYTLNIEVSNNSKQVFFNVYNKSFDDHKSTIHPMGLSGLIEIRNGVPAMSIGISPDENIIHLLSNNSTELAVIKEIESDKPTWMPVDFASNKDNGLVFSVENEELLQEARLVLADEAFTNHDFGDIDVKDDSGWEVEDNSWVKVVFLECTDDRSSVKKEFKVLFTDNGTHIISAEC